MPYSTVERREGQYEVLKWLGDFPSGLPSAFAVDGDGRRREGGGSGQRIGEGGKGP